MSQPFVSAYQKRARHRATEPRGHNLSGVRVQLLEERRSLSTIFPLAHWPLICLTKFIIARGPPWSTNGSRSPPPPHKHDSCMRPWVPRRKLKLSVTILITALHCPRLCLGNRDGFLSCHSGFPHCAQHMSVLCISQVCMLALVGSTASSGCNTEPFIKC